MHLKYLPHGKGSTRAAVDYLVGERDAEGHRREGVEVVRGNPDMVAAMTDSLEFERKYTSAVIAWAPEDRPTDEQIRSRPRRVREERRGRDWHRTATRGRQSCIASAGAASTRTSSPRNATSQTGRSLNIAPPG